MGRGICLVAVEMTLKKTSPKEGRGKRLVTVSFFTYLYMSNTSRVAQTL